MRIGICAYWFNRGQAVVARQLRSALDSLGHETHVLARPTRASNIRPAFVDLSGVWNQPRVTIASQFQIPPHELVGWADERQLELCFFDQNYGFAAIEALRRSGTRTVGRFVWEAFRSEHAAAAKRAFDVIYSLTNCERERYASMGIESPRVHWGIHPELLVYAEDRDVYRVSDGCRDVVFFYPAGYLTPRKPILQLLRAFRRVPGHRVRLVIKGQVRGQMQSREDVVVKKRVERQVQALERATRRDPRVRVILEDLPTDKHLSLFAAADICVAPSRWEGLGLHLTEAMALGLPTITNNAPPMNEVIRDGDNGLLVRSWRRGHAPSGIPAHVPSVWHLQRAMSRLLDPQLRCRLEHGARATRERLTWERTMEDYAQLITRLAYSKPSLLRPGSDRRVDDRLI